MDRLLAICLGGALGSGARYLISSWVQGRTDGSFPYGTLSVNLLGSFLLGLVVHAGFSTDALSPTTRLALTTGALGGFTTYSTFSYETLRLLQQGDWDRAVANVLATVLACLVACYLGLLAARGILD